MAERSPDPAKRCARPQSLRASAAGRRRAAMSDRTSMAAERRAGGVRAGSVKILLTLPYYGHAYSGSRTRYGRACGVMLPDKGSGPASARVTRVSDVAQIAPVVPRRRGPARARRCRLLQGAGRNDRRPGTAAAPSLRRQDPARIWQRAAASSARTLLRSARLRLADQPPPLTTASRVRSIIASTTE